MRAKVTLTRNLEDIPDLIVEHMRQSKDDLSILSAQKFNYLEPALLFEQISQYRLALSDIDAILEDAQSLLKGYVSAMQSQNTEEGEIEEEEV